MQAEFEGSVTNFAPHHALKMISSGKLTFDERVVGHRVGACTARLGGDARRGGAGRKPFQVSAVHVNEMNRKLMMDDERRRNTTPTQSRLWTPLPGTMPGPSNLVQKSNS